MPQNIKFNYLYRDAGNYKIFGNVVFSNPEYLSLVEIKDSLEKTFIQKLFFIAKQIELQELFFEEFPLGDDISFHEFNGIEITEELPNDSTKRTIREFIELVELESSKGWKVFDPMERFFRFEKS
ncbi:MAG: hypothetical protein IH589_00910 [Anaerolineales bacterium]|nr:hypothetical protein [Anaerolineales bacterium]